MGGTEEIALGYLTTRIGHPEPGTSKLRSTIAAEASTTAGNIFSICRKGRCFRKGDCGILLVQEGVSFFLEGIIFFSIKMPQHRLYIFQYGSNLDPRTMEQADFFEIELYNSISDIAYEYSNSASRAHSNSSASEASTGVRNELPSSSPQDLSENFYDLSRFFQGKIEEIGADLPSNWSPEEFTRMVIGEEEVLDPSYLSDVYSNLLECGFHSCYWEQAF